MKYKLIFNHEQDSMTKALAVPKGDEWLDKAKELLNSNRDSSNTEIFEEYLEDINPQSPQELMAASLIYGYTAGGAKVLRHLQQGVIPSSLILECLSQKLKDSEQDMGYGMKVDGEAILDNLGNDKDDF